MPILKRELDASPDNLFELTSPWLVAHVRSRQEKSLARYLEAFAVPFYLPQMEKRTRRAGRSVISYIPLFGGYVFFRGAQHERQRALRSDVVVSVLEPFDQVTLHGELAQLRRLQLTDGRFIPHPYLAPGDSVAISEGAFKGYHGTVVREKGRERLVVSVSMIQQSVSVEIDREMLVPQQVVGRGFRSRPEFRA